LCERVIHRSAQIGRGIDERTIEIKDNSGGQAGHVCPFNDTASQSNAFNFDGDMAGQKT
jgi:hypothetical protein